MSALNTFLRPAQCFHRIIGPVENHIGTDKPLPALDIIRRLFQFFGKARNHALDHLGAVLAVHARRSFDLRGIRTSFLDIADVRRITGDLLIEPRQRGLRLIAPGNICGRFHQQFADQVPRLGQAALLHPAVDNIELRPHVFRIKFQRVPEYSFGFGRDLATGGRSHRFAQSELAGRAVTIEADGVLIGGDGIGRAAQTQIDRRQHFPALPVIGIERQMRFGAGNQFGWRALVRRLGKPLRQWLRWQDQGIRAWYKCPTKSAG